MNSSKDNLEKDGVTIILPAYNEEKFIGHCLDSLIELNYPKELIQIILVDNGSKDNTVNIAKKYLNKVDLKIEILPGVNVSGLRNAGVRLAKNKYIAFLDSDCTVEKDWVISAIKNFSENNIGVVGSSHQLPKTPSWVANTWHLTIKRHIRRGERDTLPSGNMFVRRTEFIDIGGFDENLKSNEDYELCLRYRQNGYIVFSDPEIKATHHGIPKTLISFFKQQKWHGLHVNKVFIRNIKKIRSIRDLKPFKVVFYGYYNLILHILFILILISCLIGNKCVSLVYIILAIVIPAFIFGSKCVIKQKGTIKQAVLLTILYYFYGMARAFSTLISLKYLK